MSKSELLRVSALTGASVTISDVPGVINARALLDQQSDEPSVPKIPFGDHPLLHHRPRRSAWPCQRLVQRHRELVKRSADATE
jgi:hypothetical protein